MSKELLWEALAGLEEAAKLIWIAQSKRMNGTYTEEDSRFESAMYEIIAKHRRTIKEAIAQPVQPADGWMLVPIHPTPEMINAGRSAPMCATAAHNIIEDYVELYKAMIAASPKPVQPKDAS